MKEWVTVMPPSLKRPLFYSVPIRAPGPYVVTTTRDWMVLEDSLKDGTVRAAPQEIDGEAVRELLVVAPAVTFRGEEAKGFLANLKGSTARVLVPTTFEHSLPPGPTRYVAGYLPPGEAWVLPTSGLGYGFGSGGVWALVLVSPIIRAVRLVF